MRLRFSSYTLEALTAMSGNGVSFSGFTDIALKTAGSYLMSIWMPYMLVQFSAETLSLR